MKGYNQMKIDWIDSTFRIPSGFISKFEFYSKIEIEMDIDVEIENSQLNCESSRQKKAMHET